MDKHNSKALGLALLLAIFATPASYAGQTQTTKLEPLLEQWVGHSAQELVSVWGYAPFLTQAPNGNRVYAYWRNRPIVAPLAGSRPSHPKEYSCFVYVSFELDATDTIVRATHDGRAPTCWKKVVGRDL